MRSKMSANGTILLAELAARAGPSAGHGVKNAAKWNASQRVMAVIIPPKCTMRDSGIAGEQDRFHCLRL